MGTEEQRDHLDALLRAFATPDPEPGQASPCLSEEALISLRDGAMQNADNTELDAHLAACPACRRRLVTEWLAARAERERVIHMPPHLRMRLHRLLHPSDEPRVISLIFRGVSQVLERISQAGEVLALPVADVRSSDAARTYRIELEHGTVEIATDRQKNGDYEVWLKAPARKNCTWQLWRGNELVEQIPSANGEAFFPDLEKTQYRCVLLVDGEIQGNLDLTFEEE